MKIFPKFSAEAVKIILKNGIGVIPTDTIYGIVCSAFSKRAINEIYRLRKRSANKPVIVLIGSKSDVRMFGVKLDPRTSNILNKLWPGPVSIILQIANSKKQIAKFKYLHRGKKAIAFRMPAVPASRRFLSKTGPLIAPSANFEGKQPAKTIKEAQKYFGDNVDFYVDGGKLKSKPSTLISIKDGKISIIRRGINAKLLTNN